LHKVVLVISLSGFQTLKTFLWVGMLEKYFLSYLFKVKI